MANQPRFFPNLSQESSHLEQQQPLCAFHTGSEKENIHASKEFSTGAQQHSAVLSSWRTRQGPGKCSSSHQWLSLLCICTFQSPCTSPFRWPLHPCWGGQGMGKSSKSREGHQKGTYTWKEQAAIGSYSLIKPHKFSPIGKWWEDANSLTKTLNLCWHTAQASVQEVLSHSPTGGHPAFSCA